MNAAGAPHPPTSPLTVDLGTVRTLLAYTDWSNDQLLARAAGLSDEQLDRDLEIGVGGMRRTMLHIYNGEMVWAKRWRGGADAETRWPSETEKATVSQLQARFEANRARRDAYLAELAAAGGGGGSDLSRIQEYRDSKGSMFRASLGDMLIQGVMHSKHHQAQAANILRRLGAGGLDLDYMYHVRKASEG